MTNHGNNVKMLVSAHLAFLLTCPIDVIPASIVAQLSQQPPNPIAMPPSGTQEMMSPPPPAQSYAVVVKMPDIKENYTAFLMVSYDGASISENAILTPNSNSVSWSFEKTKFFPEQPGGCGTVSMNCWTGTPAFTGTAQELAITIGKAKAISFSKQYSINCQDLDTQGTTTIIVQNGKVKLLDHLQKPIQLTSSNKSLINRAVVKSTTPPKTQQPNLQQLQQKLSQEIFNLVAAQMPDTQALQSQQNQQFSLEAKIYEQLIAQIQAQTKAALLMPHAE